MSCRGCYKSFSLLRPEKGCPSCGFSYCSKCLGHKVYLPAVQAVNKVCLKCKNASMSNSEKRTEFAPPDAYYKRIGLLNPESTMENNSLDSSKDDEVLKRLNKLRDDSEASTVSAKQPTDAEIAERLQKIKGDIPTTTDDELHARLAKLRGYQQTSTGNKPIILTKDNRTEQEQVEDLMKQYMENTAIDCKYKDEFNSLINDMESRLERLKSANAAGASGSQSKVPENAPGPHSNSLGVPLEERTSENEDESVQKIIEKLKTEALLEEDEIVPKTQDELPFCEICNEDAIMRCLGCRYLFCKQCFLEHRDDDDDCNKYESYKPPKESV